MEQNKISRENFWRSSGMVNEELANYQKASETDKVDSFSMIDAWFTLFCC